MFSAEETTIYIQIFQEKPPQSHRNMHVRERWGWGGGKETWKTEPEPFCHLVKKFWSPPLHHRSHLPRCHLTPPAQPSPHPPKEKQPPCGDSSSGRAQGTHGHAQGTCIQLAGCSELLPWGHSPLLGGPPPHTIYDICHNFKYVQFAWNWPKFRSH